jgi:hypothetical protein
MGVFQQYLVKFVKCFTMILIYLRTLEEYKGHLKLVL